MSRACILLKACTAMRTSLGPTFGRAAERLGRDVRALKYGGSAEVSVQAQRDSIIVRIEDRGPGIATED